jgi:hypothetical protein
MVGLLKHGRGLLVLLAVMAIALAACGSSGGGKTSGATQGPGQSQATESQATESQATGGDISGAAGALENISSYKFNMVLAGDYWGSMLSSLSALGGNGTGGTYTMSGTIISKPAKAADITILGIRMIEVEGVTYMDLSGTGTYLSMPSSGESLADSFSPASLLGGMMGSFSGTGFNKVGTEQKNGVTADHYSGTQAAVTELDQMTNLAGATWQIDMWIAQDGGYPVSLNIVGTTDGQVGFQMTLDVTNINDPANKVTKPTNVTGV